MNNNITHILRSERIGTDADDPAIWIPPRSPFPFIVFGTNKASKADGGSIVALNPDGKIIHQITGIDRPNNCSVVQGIRTRNGHADLLLATERLTSRLRAWELSTQATKIVATEVSIEDNGTMFPGETGDQGAPMGIAAFRNHQGNTELFVSRKGGPKYGYTHHLLLDATKQMPSLTFIRALGMYSGTKEMEALAVTTDGSKLYTADERHGVRQISIKSGLQTAFISGHHFEGDQEGIATVKYGRSEWIVCTDQIPDRSRYLVFRDGRWESPATTWVGESDDTDGIEISNHIRDARFPAGILVAMHSKGACFDYYAIPSRIDIP
jgi:3-phytase